MILLRGVAAVVLCVVVVSVAHATESVWDALRAPGSVVILRHSYAPGGFDPPTARYMLTLIEGSLAYMRNTAAHDPSGSVTHHHGEQDHLAFLERPFHEAAALLHGRMHKLGIAH